MSPTASAACLSRDAMIRPAGKSALAGRRGCGCRGFTLVELVVIMIVIGILAVVALPRLDLLGGFDEIGYRDKVKATLEFARKSAVAMRRQVTVSVVGSGLTVEFQKQTPEGEGTAGLLPLNLPGGTSNQFSAPTGISLAGPAALTFSPLGAATAASYTYTVTGDAAHTITVVAETGHVH